MRRVSQIGAIGVGAGCNTTKSMQVILGSAEVGKPLSEVTGWVRARLAFAILRATNLCIRGIRVKWRSAVHMDDGAGLEFAYVLLCVCLLFIH